MCDRADPLDRSRNGVRVNGSRIEGKKKVAHGDQIAIGSQEMVVMSRRDIAADTLIQAPTQRVATFGLLGIRERVHLLGGQVELTSLPGKGLTLRVTLPEAAFQTARTNA